MTWQVYALLSAAAAGATAVFAKVGVESVPSNLATLVRTVVILAFASVIVVARGEHRALGSLSLRAMLFLGLSGCATGVSWLAYFRALQLGPASRVAPVDKLSLAFTLVLATVFLHESLTWQVAAGTALMLAGALLTLL
jgi:bacterial/archaeal transporter family protein